MGKKQMNVKPETGRALRDRKLCYLLQRGETDRQLGWWPGIVLGSTQAQHLALAFTQLTLTAVSGEAGRSRQEDGCLRGEGGG